VDRTGSVPLRQQVEAQLRDAICTGRLAAGDRLPSSRSLAADLGVSRGVVQECFAQLQAEGYLVSRGGSVTRVAALSVDPTPEPVRAAPPARPGLIASFESGVPDLGQVPLQDWAWAVREACRAIPTKALDYGDPRGDQQLRDVLAGHLRRVRAVQARSDQVVVCAGFQQGLGIVLRALAARGVTCVACEDPGSLGTVAAAASMVGMRMVPVPVDESGLDVTALAATDARAVLVTPAHQWPTGVVLEADRRHQLLEWARERDGFVIEDDYDAEFRYDREPVGSMQGLAPDRVVALGTVSKSLAPALRLGWAVVPPQLLDDVTAAKQVADRSTPVIDQLALATLIDSGRFDRHLRRMRMEYSSRRDTLVEALADHAPEVRLSGLAAGFHAVAHLPDGADENEVVVRALALGVGVAGIGRFRSDKGTRPPRLVLGFGNTNPRAIRTGIETIAPLLNG
jgi:GntR family transcriptional regulator/MocR family aminotransferase